MKVATPEEVEFLVWVCRTALAFLQSPPECTGIRFTVSEGEEFLVERAELLRLLERASGYGDSELSGEDVVRLLTCGPD